MAPRIIFPSHVKPSLPNLTLSKVTMKPSLLFLKSRLRWAIVVKKFLNLTWTMIEYILFFTSKLTPIKSSPSISSIDLTKAYPRYSNSSSLKRIGRVSLSLISKASLYNSLLMTSKTPLLSLTTLGLLISFL